MTVFIVTRHSDGAEVYRYEAPEPIECIGFEFSTHDHTAAPEPEQAPQSAPAPGREMTKLAYLRLFSQGERIAIRAAAQTSDELTDYLELLNLADVVNTADADTRRAVRMLEAVGLIGPGRANEILGGGA